MMSRPWRSVVACLSGLLVLAGSAGAAEEKSPAAAPARTLALTVVDKATGQPIAKAEVSYDVDNGKSKKLATDEKGVVAIPLPAVDPKYLSVTAKFPKHVPTSLTFRNDSENAKQPIPASFSLPLEPGTVLGGIIQDPDGKPVEGATVYLLVPSNNEGTVRAAIWDFTVKTDVNGHWQTDVMPADLSDIWIRLKHPDFASDTMYGQTAKPPMEKLRDGTGVMVLKRGITVAGRVTDEKGNPVAGASVAQGSDRWGSHYPSTKTDAEGRYSFKNVKAGEMVLTVQGKGFAPDLKSLTVQANQPAVDFKLVGGRVLKGHVVDPDGKPIANATIVADTWRGNRSIEWRAKTDAAGAFKWDSAPVDAVTYNSYAEGYAYNRSATLTASEADADTDNKVTLSRPLPVHVTVTDADTHQPVTRYRLVTGISWGNGQPPYWERREQGALDHPEGKSDFMIHEPRPGHAVRIEAEGYAPVDSRVFLDSEGTVTLALEVHKAAGLTATVLTPDGKPAAGAEAGLAVLPYGLRVENGRIAQQSDNMVTRTDAAGKFKFPPQNGPYKLVLTHDAGFAVLTPEQISADKPITLQAWGHVDGTLKVGAKPGAGEIVYGWYGGEAYRQDQPNVMMWVQSNADATGRFRIDRVPPGELHLGRQVKLSDRSTGYSHNVPVTLKPGETRSVAIGGTGRPVTGRVVIPADILARGNWTPSHAELATEFHAAKPNIPDEVQAMSVEEKKKWYEKWKESPEGKAFEEAQKKALAERRTYPVPLNADGTFRIEDVPAGSYTLSVTIADAPPTNKCGWGDELASGSAGVTVPEMAGGRSDEAIEVPSLAVAALKHVSAGDAAPEFACKTVDGKEIKLSDFKGKYVLLDFWATWCGPCVAETPHVKAAYDAFGKDDRFALVSLSLDDEPGAPQKYAQKNNLPWTQGFLGDWSKTKVPDSYGVHGIPSIWLIGPDGKVIAKDLRGDTIKDAVGKALGK